VSGPGTNNVVYTIDVNTDGTTANFNIPAPGADFIDTLPSGLVPTSATCRVADIGNGGTNTSCCDQVLPGNTTTVYSNGSTGGPTISGQNVICNGLLMEKSANIEFKITVTSELSGSFINIASANTPSGTQDEDPTNNTDTEPTIVGGPDLSLTKSVVTASPYNVGDFITYRLTVNNTSSTTTSTGLMTVVDPLPLTAVDYISAQSASGSSGWSCAHNDSTNTVTCVNSNSLASSTSSSIDITVKLLSSGTIDNGDTFRGNATISQVQRTGGATDVVTITTSAAHNYQAGDVVVVDANDNTFDGTFTVLPNPTATQFQYSQDAGNVATKVATGTVTLLSPQDSRQKVKLIKVGDPVITNNASNASITVQATDVDLKITKAEQTAPFSIGQTEAYRLTVKNVGTTTAQSPLTIVDELPAGLTFQYAATVPAASLTSPAIETPWTCTESSQTVTCVNYSNLATNTTTGVDLYVQTSNTSGSVTNQARVTSSSDICTDFTDANCDDDNVTNPAVNKNGERYDNKTQLITTINPQADLAITKTPVDQDTVTAGNQFYDATPGTYTITVTNNGPSNYTGAVLVNEDLGGITPTDPNFTYLSHSGSGWTCTQSGTANPCVAGNKNLQFSKTGLQAGESSTLTLTVSVPDGTTPNNYTNAVSLDNATLTAANDTIAGNNSATATVQVVNNVTTFTIQKDDDDGAGEPTTSTLQTQFVKGGVGQYTVLVTNSGSVAAPAPVTITDTFPDGLTYASYDPKPTDWQCTGVIGGPSVSCIYGQWNTNFTSFTQKDFPAGLTSGVALNVNVANNTPPTTSTLSTGKYINLTTNTASVSGSNFTTVNASEDTAIIEPADLQVTKTLDADGDGTADTTLLTAGSTGVSRYSLTVQNNGLGTSYAPIYLQDYLPTGVTYNSNITLPAGWTFRGYNTQSNEVSYVYSGDLASGADAGTIVMAVNVSVTAPSNTINLARVDGFTPEPDYDLTTPGYQDPKFAVCDRFFTTQPVNNCVTLERGVSNGVSTDLEVIKLDDTPSDVNGADDDLDSVPFNTSFTYTIRVQNNGSKDANSVNLSDSIPEGLNFVSVAIDSGDNTSTNPYGTGSDVTRVCSFDNLADRLNCNLYKVSSTESSTDPIDITVTVTPILSGTIPNTAVVTSTTADSNSANNSELEETIVTGGTGNTISGTVFIDKNNNAAYNAGTDTPDQDITVRLYRDANNNNAIDANDVLLATTSSAADGTYSFVTSLTGNFVVVVDTTDGDLPSNATWNTATVLDATLGATLGATDANNDFGYETPPGNVLFVKRITAVNGVPITGFEDDTTTPKASEDSNALWPTAKAQYLRGAIGNRGTAPNNTPVNVQPGQDVEYTVYFLSSGGSPVRDVKFCDLIPAKMTYVPGSMQLGYNTVTLADPTGAGTTLTDAADGDKGTFYEGGTAAPSICTISNANGGNDNNSSTNDTGAVFVQIVDAATTMPYATGAGTPAGSYGFVRFRAKVN